MAGLGIGFAVGDVVVMTGASRPYAQRLRLKVQSLMGLQAVDQLFQLFAVLFEQFQALAQFADGGVLWIDSVDHVVHDGQIVGTLAIAAHNAAGDADDGAVGRDILVDDGVCADAAVVADNDIAQDLGAHAHQHAVAQSGMAFELIQAGAAQGDLMIHQDIVPDDGCLADDDAIAMVDEEAPPDGGAGVNLDVGDQTAELGDDARKQHGVTHPEPVRDVVQPERMQTGIGQHLQHAARRRVFGEHGLYIFT